MPDQEDLTGSRELRLVAPPARPVRGATLLVATVRRRPWGIDRLTAGMEDALTGELGAFNPDVVHVVGWALAGVGKALSGMPSVLTALDAWHLNAEAGIALTNRLRRPLVRAEARRIRNFEAEEFSRFGRVVVVSDQDKAALEELNPSLNIAAIPNGVDADFYSGDRTPVSPGRIVFTGDMGYPPNILAARWLARQVFPRVRQAWPDAQLRLVGRNPAREVLALRDLSGVEVTGEVPDVRPWLRSARVFACPMISGTGIKNKLLEAMACELPCVVTPLALQGFDVEPGEHVLVGATEEELGAQILTLLSDDALADKLGSAARAYVLRHHTWAAAADAYERVYSDVRNTPGLNRR